MRTVVRQHPLKNFDSVVERGVAEDLKTAMHGAALWVIATVDEPGDPRLNHGAGAHRTGLHGNVDSGAIQPVISEAFGRCAQGHDLRMRAWVAIGNRAISGPRK